MRKYKNGHVLIGFHLMIGLFIAVRLPSVSPGEHMVRCGNGSK